MKVDERFHCFGCQADGDVISFTSRLFDLSPKDAALELASDFGIERLSRCICGSIFKEVEYSFIAGLYGLRYGFERLEARLIDSIVPLGKLE